MMPSHAASLAAAFESRDLGRLIDLLDAQILWRGVTDETEHEQPQGDEYDEDHDHGPPLCTDRDQVRDVFERFIEGGATGYPVVLAEVGDTVVVDPRPEPALQFPLHQNFTFRGDRVVLIQDYPDRASAMAAVGL